MCTHINHTNATNHPQLTQATEGSAGFDLRASKRHTIPPGKTVMVGTGVSIGLPPHWVGLLLPRSSLCVRHGLQFANSVGVIDSDYRGELLAAIRNPTNTPVVLREGERFAQLLVVPAPPVVFRQVQHLEATKRGDNGFGSTGVM